MVAESDTDVDPHTARPGVRTPADAVLASGRIDSTVLRRDGKNGCHRYELTRSGHGLVGCRRRDRVGCPPDDLDADRAKSPALGRTTCDHGGPCDTATQEARGYWYHVVGHRKSRSVEKLRAATRGRHGTK